MSDVEPDLEAGVATASAKAAVKLEADPKAAATVAVTPPPQNVEEGTPRQQWAFVRKVYAVILLQYWLAGGIVAVTCFVPAIPRFFKSPNVAVYFAFIAIVVAPFIGTTVLQSMILTEAAMINLIIYTFWAAIRHYKVTFLFPFLITHLLTFVIYLTIQVNCPLGSVNMTGFGCCVTILFVAFIIHDIDLLIKRHKYKEYIFAAVSLYSDFINLAFSYLSSPSK